MSAAVTFQRGMDSLQGQVAIVTGGGTGIGRAIALRLAREGVSVVVSARHEKPLQSAVDEMDQAGAQALAIPGDVSSATDRQHLIDETLTRFGRIDCLVNNAAITNAPAIGQAIDETLEHFERVLAVNLTGAFMLSQLCARHMRERGSGTIINISSVAGSAAQEGATAYCASKAGMEGMTRVLALEWAPFGIRVNAVAPGDILTESSSNVVDTLADSTSCQYLRKTPLGRRAAASEIAGVVAFLASDDASFITGETIRADGGFLIY